MMIIVDAPVPKAQAEKVLSLSTKIELAQVPAFGQPLPKDLLKEAEVIYTTEADFDPADAPRLRWVQTNTAATNPIMHRPIMRGTIPVANVAGAYSVAVAECALGMLLALTRRIKLGARAEKWPEDFQPWQGEDLYGKTMGVVGYGSIGRQIARLANALGMTVLACKRRPDERRDDSYLLPGTGDPEGRIPKAWFSQSELREMLGQSDIAVLALPDVPTTQQLIGKAELAALPPHAYLVNVSRGAVVDEPVLIESLRAGAIAGAALDVFAEEPLPATSPFWKMPNVLVMPHIASWTDMQATRATEVLIENLCRDLAGEPLLNLIDKKLMY